MGTHAHANGKAASKTHKVDVHIADTDEVKEVLRRIEVLESEKAANDAATAALKEEVSRLVDENARLGQFADGVRKEDEQKAVKRLEARAKVGVEMRVASIRQRKEWANSLVHDAQEIVDFAGLAGEGDIGELAIRLKHAAARREKECEAQLSAHALNTHDEATS